MKIPMKVKLTYLLKGMLLALIPTSILYTLTVIDLTQEIEYKGEQYPPGTVIVERINLSSNTVKQINQRDLSCLAQNIYHEARGESNVGQYAVALVTLNRVHSDKFPNTVCGVVWQPSQFSWTNDGKSDRTTSKVAWDKAVDIAKDVLANHNHHLYDVTEGATYYHADYVKPYWIAKLNKTTQIDSHIFYR